MERLIDAELTAGLSALAGWAAAGATIEKTYAVADFVAAMALANRVADLAVAAGHAPSLTIAADRVRVSLSTPAAGGPTAADLRLASQIERVA